MSAIQKNETYRTVLQLLSGDKDGKLERILEDIVDWEKNNPAESEYDGFEWYNVHADPRLLNKLVREKVIDVVLKTNSGTQYRMVDVKAVEKGLADYQGAFTQVKEETQEVPEDLFTVIVGHKDKKDLITRSIKGEKPVHFLLWGSVASAKTLMLEELSRLPNSRFVLGSSLTKAGVFDVLFNERPTYLIIDELDKITDSENLSCLLSLMHKGLVTETKYRRHRTLRLKTWVFASANEIHGLPAELMSRFQPLRFRDYEVDEFYDVVVNVLKAQENVGESLSLYIAQQTINQLDSRDVRDSIKIARLLKNKTKEDVDYIVDIMKKQR